MKHFLTVFALLLLCIPAAQAKDYGISVTEVNTFFAQLNSNLSNPNIHVGRSFLEYKVDNRAIFVTNYQNYLPRDYRLDVVSGHVPYYGYYNYRYPYAYASNYPLYKTSSVSKHGKTDMINNFDTKKQLIAGYKPEYLVTGIKITPDSKTAVVDVSLKEYGYRYAPYDIGYARLAEYSTSSCKVYLTQKFDELFIARRDCNTVSYLPY